MVNLQFNIFAFCKIGMLPLSLPKIGELFGGKDHTTVMYSCEKISQLRHQDRDLAQTLRQLSDKINFTSRSH